MPLTAGSSVLDITPASPCHLGGYASRDHPHENIHDPLSLRALYVTNGTDEIVLVSADLLWFRKPLMNPVHDAISSELGIPNKHVMLCGTHTHSAPITNGDNRNRQYLHFVTGQALAAVAIAKSRAQTVNIRSARGTSKIGINRREQIADGSVILGENPDGTIDREIVLTSLESDGKTVAEICSFAAHGTVMGGDSYVVSGDWCGLAASTLEKQSDSAFLFMSGGSANINPRGRTRPSTFNVAISLAEEFVCDISDTRSSLSETATDDALGGAFRPIGLPRKLRDIEDGKGKIARTRIHGLRIGPLRILGFPGEVFSQTTMSVKKVFSPSLVAVNSYTTGGEAGYVPVKEAYDTGGYEGRVSPYSEEGEAVLRSEFIALAESLR